MRRWRSVLAAGMVGVLAAGLAAAPATAAAPSRSQRITFYFGLKRPEAQAVAAFYAVQQVGSPTYRAFGTLAQISARYGASPATRTAFLGQIRRLGLTASIDRSGVFARVTGTVQRLERAFGVKITSEFSNDTISTAYGTAGNRPLRLPPRLRPLVQDVVADYARSSRFPTARTAAPPAPRAKPSGPKNQGTWIGGCAKARALGAYSFDQVRNAYGISALGSGQGASVAIMNVAEGLTGQDIAENASCFGYGPVRTRTLLSDGQAHPFGRGSFEPQEDLALVRGMAPGLSSLTFTQAWGIPSLWFLAPLKVLDAHSLPDALSISYGECERAIRGPRAAAASRAGANLMDAVLVRLGLAGVSSFASAGDFGTSCDGEQFKGVAWPGSSPYLTSVGGTRLVLNSANQRAGEVVWNDLQWASPLNGGGTSGGGLSGVSARPPFQRGLPLPGNRRAVPDISAHASMFPGWPVVLAGNWELDGGTSASTPLVAAAFAILSSNQRRALRPPLGPVNGLLYALRRTVPATIYDIVTGSNSYYRTIPGYSARPGYDLASGLGVPQFAQIAAALPAAG